MKKKLIYTLISVVIPCVFYIFYLRDYRERSLSKKSNYIVVKIEEYLTHNGSLPENFDDINIEESKTEEIYYQKMDSVHYILWFGTTLGESMIYYSDSKEWEDGYRDIKNKE